MKKTKKEKISLKIEKRDVFGKKLKKSRKEGKIPANIYGKDFSSLPVFIKNKDFFSIYKKVRETGVVYLELDGQEIPVLIKNLQYHPITDKLLHVEFRKIDLTKTLETMVPIKIIGQSPAVQEKKGVLLIHVNEIKVEAKPEQIPHAIEIDISSLKEINQEIKIKDLPKNENYRIIENEEKVIVSVTAHKEESTMPEITTEKPEIIEETKKLKEEAQEEKKDQQPETDNKS